MKTDDKNNHPQEWLRKSERESYAHAMARELMCKWLRDAIRDSPKEGGEQYRIGSFGDLWWVSAGGEPDYGVFQEWPFCVSGKGHCEPWDHWENCFSSLGPGIALHSNACIQCRNHADSGCNPFECPGCSRTRFRDSPPTYQECLDMGDPPVAIADIVIRRKDFDVGAIIEIVHKHEPESRTLDFYAGTCASVWVIPTQWVLGQIGVPKGVPEKFRLNLPRK